ncbi:MAG TPA: hypothetical protein VMV79_02610 [Alphaproteobacteria bacterium]|nr:hypothetical protein [Alphaproteobacteria bacterium]
MDKITLGLMAVFMIAMALVVMPNVIALNRGRMLRNIALWLAVILTLALVYRAFGPGSPHPLFAAPTGFGPHHTQPPPGSENNGAHGYTPPGD